MKQQIGLYFKDDTWFVSETPLDNSYNLIGKYSTVPNAEDKIPLNDDGAMSVGNAILFERGLFEKSKFHDEYLDYFGEIVFDVDANGVAVMR